MAIRFTRTPNIINLSIEAKTKKLKKISTAIIFPEKDRLTRFFGQIFDSHRGKGRKESSLQSQILFKQLPLKASVSLYCTGTVHIFFIYLSVNFLY